MSVDVKTVVLIVGWVLSGAGLYYGLDKRLDLQAAAIAVHTKEVTQALQENTEERKVQQALDRALIEVIATLKAKKVLQ